MGAIRGLRSFGNKLGFAWWAKVETNTPEVTYWFGPFLTRRSLKLNLSNFVEDLSFEVLNFEARSLIQKRLDEIKLRKDLIVQKKKSGNFEFLNLFRDSSQNPCNKVCHGHVKIEFSMFQVSNRDFHNEKCFRRPMQMTFNL